jgi:error-prone DNA polymerase
MTKYAELHTHSYFSLLDGATSPEMLVQQAQELGLTALALTDHDSLAGAIRFWTAAQSVELHVVIGTEVTLEDGHHLTLLAETQRGYANLCRLLTRARLDVIEGPSPQRHGGGTEEHRGEEGEVAFDLDNWPGKVEPSLSYARLGELSGGLIALSGCRKGPVAAPLLDGDDRAAYAAVERLAGIFDRDHFYIEIQHHYLPDDQRLNRQLVAVAQAFELPLVATNNVHYATNTDKPLHDVLIATRHNETLAEAQQAGHLPVNSAFELASPAEMARRFQGYPKTVANEALANSVAISERCRVSLDFSDQRLPEFSLPAEWNSPHAGYDDSAFAYLYQLCHESLPQRYPHLKPNVLTQLAHELDVIEQAGLAGYFLIVWDIVRYAKEIGVRCQGRGSAANSIVAYLLGITSIDPLQHNLLFERFLSRDKFTTPDIDIDFATGLELDAVELQTSDSSRLRSGGTRDY